MKNLLKALEIAQFWRTPKPHSSPTNGDSLVKPKDELGEIEQRFEDTLERIASECVVIFDQTTADKFPLYSEGGGKKGQYSNEDLEDIAKRLIRDPNSVPNCNFIRVGDNTFVYRSNPDRDYGKDGSQPPKVPKNLYFVKGETARLNGRKHKKQIIERFIGAELEGHDHRMFATLMGYYGYGQEDAYQIYNHLMGTNHSVPSNTVDQPIPTLFDYKVPARRCRKAVIISAIVLSAVAALIAAQCSKPTENEPKNQPIHYNPKTHSIAQTGSSFYG